MHMQWNKLHRTNSLNSQHSITGKKIEHECDHSGWLRKQGGKIKNYKRRFFVLKGHKLSYYKDSGGLQLLSSFSIDKTDIIVNKSEAELASEEKWYGFTIKSKEEGRLLAESHPYFWLAARSPEERTAWIRAIRRNLYLEKGGALFGSSLSDVYKYVKEENDYLPKVVYDCIKFIRNEGMNSEGIFRKCGQQNLLRRMADDYDTLEPNPLGAGGRHDIHAVSGLLKLYLRELPEPLIPYGSYDELKASGYRIIANEDVHIVRSHLDAIPEPNYILLKHLCAFLYDVSCSSDQNRMTSENLASVFSPNFLRRLDADVDVEMSASSLINNTVFALIKHHESMFTQDVELLMQRFRSRLNPSSFHHHPQKSKLHRSNTQRETSKGNQHYFHGVTPLSTVKTNQATNIDSRIENMSISNGNGVKQVVGRPSMPLSKSSSVLENGHIANRISSSAFRSQKSDSLGGSDPSKDVPVVIYRSHKSKEVLLNSSPATSLCSESDLSTVGNTDSRLNKRAECLNNTRDIMRNSPEVSEADPSTDGPTPTSSPPLTKRSATPPIPAHHSSIGYVSPSTHKGRNYKKNAQLNPTKNVRPLAHGRSSVSSLGNSNSPHRSESLSLHQYLQSKSSRGSVSSVPNFYEADSARCDSPFGSQSVNGAGDSSPLYPQEYHTLPSRNDNKMGSRQKSLSLNSDLSDTSHDWMPPEVERELSSLRSQLNTSRQNCASYKASLESYKHQVSSLRSDLSLYKLRHECLTGENEKLKRDISDLQAKVVSLERHQVTSGFVKDFFSHTNGTSEDD